MILESARIYTERLIQNKRVAYKMPKGWAKGTVIGTDKTRGRHIVVCWDDSRCNTVPLDDESLKVILHDT